MKAADGSRGAAGERGERSREDAQKPGFAKQKRQTAGASSITATLDVTGDVVLNGSEKLGTFVLDRGGALSMDHTTLYNVVLRLVRAINAQGEQLNTILTESDGLHGTVHAVEQQVLSFESRINEIEDLSRKMGVQLDTISANERADAGDDDIKHEDFVQLQERVAALAERIDAVDQQESSNAAKLGGRLTSCEEVCGRHQDTLDDDVEPHLSHLDDVMLALKMDLESVQVSLKDVTAKKASRAEFGEMQKNIEEVLEQQRAEQATLQDAHRNLQKLDACVTMAAENRERVQEIWRILKEESQESRDWCARQFSDLRGGLVTKMDGTEVLGYIEDLRGQVRSCSSIMAAATSRVEAGFRHKAEIGDVVRLQDTLEDMRTQSDDAPRQLLLGTRCLACGRGITSADGTDQGPVDALGERQHEGLIKNLQRMLSSAHGPPGDQEAVKYVAVHVGSPARVRGAGAGPSYEGRDARDHSPGTYSLLREPGGSRPGTRGRTPQGAAGGARMLPREVPPLVRIVKRPPGLEQRAAASPRVPLPNPHQPATHRSVRAALGTTRPTSQRPLAEQCQTDYGTGSTDADELMSHQLTD
mmetsp:Transcript_38075/g.107600  ORF Transcript_38075/g.107600 Transcript_38075/m.107600 type:complete len:588 (+) Transcript_38075:1-1764(+)